MKSILSAAASAALVAFGLFGAQAVTQTAASLVEKSGDAVRGVEVELREKSGGKVVGRATTDADGKFAFRDVPRRRIHARAEPRREGGRHFQAEGQEVSPDP